METLCVSKYGWGRNSSVTCLRYSANHSTPDSWPIRAHRASQNDELCKNQCVTERSNNNVWFVENNVFFNLKPHDLHHKRMFFLVSSCDSFTEVTCAWFGRVSGGSWHHSHRSGRGHRHRSDWSSSAPDLEAAHDHSRPPRVRQVWEGEDERQVGHGMKKRLLNMTKKSFIWARALKLEVFVLIFPKWQDCLIRSVVFLFTSARLDCRAAVGVFWVVQSGSCTAALCWRAFWAHLCAHVEKKCAWLYRTSTN